MHLCTKFQVSSSTRFGGTLGCTPKFIGSRDRDHSPFLDFSLRVFEILPVCICVPNFKSLSSLALEVRYGVRQNLRGSRDLGHAPFLDFSLRVFEILPLCTCVPNFKSLARPVLEIG